jgi:hypothetical protein
MAGLAGPEPEVAASSRIVGKQEEIDRATASRGHLGGTWRTVFTVRRSELARWVEHEQLTGHSELACELSRRISLLPRVEHPYLRGARLPLR